MLVQIQWLKQQITIRLDTPTVDYFKDLSDELGIPLSEILRIASFYNAFSLTPKGDHSIHVCTGTACYVKGIKEAMSRIESQYQVEEGGTTDDRRFSLEAVRCLGACGLAPVMVVGQDTYGDVSSGKVIDLLDKYE